MITLNGTTGITNDGGYTGDGVVFADTTPANTLVTTTGGNVGIGTSSPSSKFQVAGDVRINTVGTATTGLPIYAKQTNNDQRGIWTESATTDSNGRFYCDNSVVGIAASYSSTGSYLPITFTTSATERARIDSSGNLLVGTTSVGGGFTSQVRQTVEAASGSNGAQILINNAGNTQWTQWIWNKGTSGDGLLMQFGTEGSFTARGSILYNRGSGVVAYNTTSDYRAKDISGPVVNALSTVAQLKPWLGTMKGATVERPMFVAHETQAVAPYAVTGEKDAVNDNGEPVYQQMDHSTLVPLLTAAIQEQQAIITALTARVTALEGA